MNQQYVERVQASYQHVRRAKSQFAALFLERLATLDPYARNLFPADTQAQEQAVFQLLDTVVACLACPEYYEPVLSRLGEQSAAFGISTEHYSNAGAAMHWALERALGEDFCEKTRLAWTSIYCAVAGMLLQARQPV